MQLIIFACLLLVVMTSCQSNWGYNNANSICSSSTPCGPNSWKTNYTMCGQKTSSTQSPVDITQAPLDDTLVTPLFITLNSGCFNWTQVNSYDDITLDLTKPGATCTNLYMSYENFNWVLQEIRFKSPSEHTIGGGHYDGEAQLIHVNTANQHIAIVSVFLSAGSTVSVNNSFFDAIWKSGGSVPVNSVTITPTKIVDDLSPYTDLLPGSMNHFQYVGSLTEPPCSEDVDWFVFKDPVPISKFDLNRIRTVPAGMTGNVYLPQSGNNNRPLQSGYGSVQNQLKISYTDGTTVYGSSGTSTTSTNSSAGVAGAALFFGLAAFIISIYNLYLAFVKSNQNFSTVPVSQQPDFPGDSQGQRNNARDVNNPLHSV